MTTTRTIVPRSTEVVVKNSPLASTYSPPDATKNGVLVYNAKRNGWVIDEQYRKNNNLARIVFVGIPEELMPYANSLIATHWNDFLKKNGSTLTERVQKTVNGQPEFDEAGKPVYKDLDGDAFDLDGNPTPEGNPTTIVIEFRSWGGTQQAQGYGAINELISTENGLIVRNKDTGYLPGQSFSTQESDGLVTADLRIAFNLQKFFLNRNFAESIRQNRSDPLRA